MIATMTGSRLRSYTTERFRELLHKMPPDARKLAKKYFKTFMEDPWAPTLDRKPLQSSEGLEFVRIGLHYRAFLRRGLLPEDGDNVVVWEWIGTTEEAHNYYWKQFPISPPTPNRSPLRRASRTRRYMKTWKAPKHRQQEIAMATMAIEEPDRPVEHTPEVVESQKVIYTGIAAQLESLLSQIHQIEAGKTKAEQEAEHGLAEALRLEDENKCLNERAATLEKKLAEERHAVALAISGARDLNVRHKHEVESLTNQINGLNRENTDLKRQITKLQKQLRKLGEFCRHCGKSHETGLLPGETE